MRRLLEKIRLWRRNSIRKKILLIVDNLNIDWDKTSKTLDGSSEVMSLDYRKIKPYLGEKAEGLALAGILFAGYDLEISSQKAISQVRSGDLASATSTIQHCAARFGLGLTSLSYSEKAGSVLSLTDGNSFGKAVAKIITAATSDEENPVDKERRIQTIKANVAKAHTFLSNELSSLGISSHTYDSLFK